MTVKTVCDDFVTTRKLSSGEGRRKSLIVNHSQNKSHFIEIETDIEIEIGKTHSNFFTLFCFDDTDGDSSSSNNLVPLLILLLQLVVGLLIDLSKMMMDNIDVATDVDE